MQHILCRMTSHTRKESTRLGSEFIDQELGLMYEEVYYVLSYLSVNIFLHRCRRKINLTNERDSGLTIKRHAQSAEILPSFVTISVPP